jgi:hypothetical protein
MHTDGFTFCCKSTQASSFVESSPTSRK